MQALKRMGQRFLPSLEWAGITMGYQTLYLKYRSQTFGDLVGQDAIARTLKNAVEQGRVAHAYLFSGVRGTGKTSTARILAKAINCLNRQGAEPCGTCAACQEIGSGAAVDLIEIDAASNRGIDEIRDLRDKVKYLPATLRVKVYIIDEAHMLTTEAFNALLKTLEEPPAHAVFVLATTEPHKIPLTVASRCQRFDFRRIEKEAIAARLQRIAESESVPADPEAITLVAQLANGSMRDAITILDQVINHLAGKIMVDTVRDLLGLADPDTLVDLLGAATAGEAAGTLARLQGFYDAGGDVRQLVRGLLQVIREAAVLSVGYREEVGGKVNARLEQIGRTAGPRVLLDLWQGLMLMEPELRKGADARLLLEVTLLRSMTAAGTEAERPVAPKAAAASGIKEPSAPAAAPVPSSIQADARWESLKQKLPRPVSSLLQEARFVASDSSLRIEFRYPAHLEQMQRADKKEMLVQATREVFGAGMGLELAALEKPAAPPASAKPAPSLAEDPVVKDAMNRFDAVNVRVIPKGGK